MLTLKTDQALLIADTKTLNADAHTRRLWAPFPIFIPGTN